MGRKSPSKSQLRREAEKLATGKREPLYIGLGLDFGTAFSKVAWRDLGTDRAGILQFTPRAAETSPFVESVVYLDRKNRCHCPFDFDVDPDNTTKIRYLKMRLAGQSIDGSPANPDLESDEVVDLLSAYYLARLIQVSKKHLQQSRSAMFLNREPQWFYCLGIPVTQYDSEVKTRFEKVLGLAEHLSRENCQHYSVDALREATHEIDGVAIAREIGAQVYPEIGAAVLSFVTSPEAPAGVYIYFDIGGGTIDGVCFRLHRNIGNRAIEYLSGEVRPLGYEVLRPFVDPAEHDRVQTMVASVIIHGNRNDPLDWRVAHRDTNICFKWYREHLSNDNKVMKLPIFLGGGGAKSRWYRDQILEAYKTRKHGKNDIPPYELKTLPVPVNISNGKSIKENYDRLAVAYGLTAAATTSVKVIGLPSKATVAEARRAHIDFDDRIRESSGQLL